MAFSELELKAINWYMNKEGLKLSGLALLREVNFESKNGEIITRNVSNLLSDFNNARKLEAKERARARKLEKK